MVMKRYFIAFAVAALLTVTGAHAQNVTSSATIAPPAPNRKPIVRKPVALPDNEPAINPATRTGPRGARSQPIPGPTIAPRVIPNQPAKPRPVDKRTIIEARTRFNDALRRSHHERHNHAWWRQHYVYIVLVGGGYYYWDAGYWFPAYGYDPSFESYDDDGPIYTYGNLLPDQVIINVQQALQDLGYYNGDVNGSLGPPTRRALSAFQNENGLDVTGTIDEATVAALGLI
jgi:hypothetical protein